MKLFLGLVGVVAFALCACTGSNAASCIDGTCSDPAKAFCDVDGSFSGTAGLCIHVDCTPGEFVSCHGNKALSCNAQGNSYESTTCPGQCDEPSGGCVGCTASGQCSAPKAVCDLEDHLCVECTASSQCSAPHPACDVDARECVECVANADCSPPRALCNVAAKQCALGCNASSQCPATEPYCDAGMMLCRRCERDSECASDLCEVATGQCIAEADITYAATNGTAGSCGTKAAPCTLAAAWTHMDATHHIIKLASGSYNATSTFTVPNTAVTIYGAGAVVSISGAPMFMLSGATTFRIDGVTFFNNGFSGFLGGAGNATATCNIALNSVTVNTSEIWGPNKCTLTVERSTFAWVGTNPGNPHLALTDVEFTFRHGVIKDAGISLTNNSRAHISNTLFLDTMRSVLAIANANGGTSDIAFSTLVNSPLDQTLTTGPKVDVSNCIVSGGGLAPNAVNGNAYTIHYSLLTPQPAAPSGSDHVILNMDPRFANPTTGDYHLLSNSPAVDAGDPAATLADDFEGTKRPQGTLRDMGAFEYKP